MPEETTATAEVQVPDNFADFESWRQTGKLPEAQPEQDKSAAPEEKPAAERDADSETADETQEQEGDEQPQPKKGGFQRRIDKLTREKHELETRIQALEGRLAEKPAGESKEKPADKTPAEPIPDNFTTYEQYLKALVAHEAKQLIADREKEYATREAEKKAAQTFESRVQSYRERVEAVRGKPGYEDFDEALAAAPNVSQAINETLLDSENGPELAYWLAKRPKEIDRINRLGPLAAARELGKIEATLTAEKAPEPPKPRVTAAPKPPTPVRHTAATSNAPEDATDFREFEKRRNAQLYRR